MENSNFEFEGFTSYNKKYIFKGKISEENLIITTSDDYEDEIFKKYFILDINFNELKKIKIFSLYETLEEAVNGLISIIENNVESKKNNIVDEETNKITLTIPVFFGKFKEIKFEFTLKTKNTEDKIDSLISTVKVLKDRINYLENLLKIKKNEKKTNDDDFKGTVIKIKCFGNNEFDNYFDLNQIPEKHHVVVSFSLICKNPKDISICINSFNREKSNVYGEYNSKHTFAREKNNKIYIDLTEENDYDPFKGPDNILSLFFALGQSLTIKTKAIPKNLFEEFNKEKILEFILDTELEFENVSPQIQIFSFFFNDFLKKTIIDDFAKALFRDIFLNLIKGNYKYRISKYLKPEQYTEQIFNFFKGVIDEIALQLFKIDCFQDNEKIDFNEIELYSAIEKYKIGFCFNFKCPELNELFKYLVEKKKENNNSNKKK